MKRTPKPKHTPSSIPNASGSQDKKIARNSTKKKIAVSPKSKGGAPKGSGSKFTKEIADEICDRMSNGETLSEICRSPHMPTRSAVYVWADERPEFQRQIARARQDGFDVIAEECIRIADDKASDPDSSSRRVRSEIRLKLLAKWDRKRYGDQLDQHIEIETGPNTLDAIKERAKNIVSALDRSRKEERAENRTKMISYAADVQEDATGRFYVHPVTRLRVDVPADGLPKGDHVTFSPIMID